MKLIETIAFLFISTLAVGQELHPFDRKDFKSLVLGQYNYIYSETNSDYFLTRAKNLIDLNNPDSSFKASKILWGLFLFDDKKYNVEQFQPLVTKIKISNKHFFEQTLIGSWRFSHDFGTGLVTQITTSTAADTGNVIKFDGCEASFFFNDSLIRRTNYTLKPREKNFEFTKYNRFDIYFYDRKQTLGFQVTNNFNEKILTFELDPSCVCGCRLDIYRRIN